MLSEAHSSHFGLQDLGNLASADPITISSSACSLGPASGGLSSLGETMLDVSPASPIGSELEGKEGDCGIPEELQGGLPRGMGFF